MLRAREVRREVALGPLAEERLGYAIADATDQVGRVGAPRLIEFVFDLYESASTLVLRR